MHIDIYIHKHICTYIYTTLSLSLSLSLYIYIHKEIVYFGKSDKMRKIRGKVDKPNTDKGFMNDISSLFQSYFLGMMVFF